MREAERLSELIGRIYDAALDASLWPEVLDDIAHFVGGPAAALFYKNASSKTGEVFYNNGALDPHFQALYFSDYVKLDPATTGHFFAVIGTPVATADVIDYEEFLTTRFYLEWAKPQNLVDFVSATLDKSATGAAMFGVFRHERDGLVDEETRRRMRLIIPHVRRAVLIGRVIDLKSAEAATFADTLDGVRAAMFLVDAGARIVHANQAGYAMLAAGDPLSQASGRLSASDSHAHQALRDVVQVAGEGDTAVGEKGVALSLLARDGDRYVAHVLSLRSGERRRTGASYAAAAAVFVYRTALYVASPPEIVAQTYKLTPTELRVMLAVVEVGGVPEVAAALGVAESTVKTHLTRLYEKTGARRHADLVKLMAGFLNPLVN